MGKTLGRLRISVSAAALTAAMAAQPAVALEYNFGDVQIFLDTTVSAGASVRTAERNKSYLPEANGGNVDLRETSPNAATLPVALATNPFAGALGAQSVSVYDALGARINNFDGSINSDDGRLNFDQGDLTSGVVKMTNDIQANWQNYTLFARVNSFYDAVLDSSGAYERNGLDSGSKVDAARDIDLLDFYVSGDFNVAEMPLNLRLGKQVISWGEGTFILNGINSVNPIDVGAFRRPGAEIKEGLVPVWALYGSLGLPYDLSLEAFYQLAWDDFRLDRAGTPFAGSDIANPNGTLGGNQGFSFNSGSALAGTFRRNCTGNPNGTAAGNGLGVGSIAAQSAALFGGAVAAAFPYANCANGSLVDMDVALPVGRAEETLLALGDLNRNQRLVDQEARDQGQFGAALRWYAEELNSTEFGFYFMNYHSRLPIAQIERVGLPTAYIQTSTGNSGSSLALGPLGCLGGSLGNFGAGQGLLRPTRTFVDPALARGGALNTNTTILDPNGFIAGMAPLADAVLAGAGIIAPGTLTASVAANGANHVDAAYINCALGILQNGTGAGALPLPVNGSEQIGLQYNTGLRLLYPEDIQLFGVSFNTTLGDWGVQGEVSFRHDQPLQVDTVQQIINAASLSCTAIVSNGDSAAFTLSHLTTFPTTTAKGTTGCNQADFFGNAQPTSFVREEVITAQIGTTATYANSNPLIGFLGADLGVLVTELGGVFVPDVADSLDITGYSAANPAPTAARLQSVCRAGTQLPLGSLVGLDNALGCEPDKFSYGYVLVSQLQYNNAFGTAVTLNPTLAWSHNVKGNTPAPLSNYREGSKSLSLALNGTYQSSWRGGISYTNFMGNEKYSANGDQDFVSVNLSYSF